MDVDPPKVHSELLFEILHITEKGNEEDDLCAFPSCMPSADSRVHFSPSKVTGNRKEGRRKETMHLESTLSRSSNLSRKCPFKDLHATELCTQHACIGSVLLHKIIVLDISRLRCSFASFLPLVLLLPSPFLCRPLPPLRRRVTTGKGAIHK